MVCTEDSMRAMKVSRCCPARVFLPNGVCAIVIETEKNSAPSSRIADISLYLFILGGVVGLFNMATTVIPFGKGFEMFALATNLVEHGAYANPFLVLDTGPSAVNPPLYPIFLALLMKVLRIPAFVVLAATVGNMIANALAAAWLPRVSLLFYGDPGPGIAASLLWLMAAQLMPAWDAGYTAAAILLFCLLTATTVRSERFILFALIAGLLAGALMLLNPVSLFVFGPWIAHLVVFRNAPLKQTVAYCSIVLVTAALLVFPWMLRNDRQIGGFLIRTSLGITLYSSNNDCAKVSLIDDIQSDCFGSNQPNNNVKEAMLVRDMGELKYDRMRLADTKAWVRAHPAPFLRLTAARLRDFWFPRIQEHPFKIAIVWIATILSIPGLVLMMHRRVRVTLFVVGVLLVFPLTYYVVFSDVRFRYPILWLTLLPAGYFLKWLFDKVPGTERLRGAPYQKPA
jgi:hypothetical protein